MFFNVKNNLNVKNKTIKALGEMLDGHLHNVGVGKFF